MATLNKTVSGDSGADDDAALLHRVLPMMYIISVGDFVHSMVDGMVIGAAFMGCDESLGWAVMVSIILHELPQELGDYILLRHSGLSHWRALVVNFLTALGSLCGVVVVVGVGSRVLSLVGYFLAFGTGVLLFIAASDILPPLMRETRPKRAVIRALLVLLSVAATALTSLVGHLHCAEHGAHEGHDH